MCLSFSRPGASHTRIPFHAEWQRRYKYAAGLKSFVGWHSPKRKIRSALACNIFFRIMRGDGEFRAGARTPFSIVPKLNSQEKQTDVAILLYDAFLESFKGAQCRKFHSFADKCCGKHYSITCCMEIKYYLQANGSFSGLVLRPRLIHGIPSGGKLDDI